MSSECEQDSAHVDWQLHEFCATQRRKRCQLGHPASPQERVPRGKLVRFQDMPEVIPFEGDDDQVYERKEQQVVKATRMPNEPRRDEVAARNATHHPFRAWCWACVAGCGVSFQSPSKTHSLLLASSAATWDTQMMACRCWSRETKRTDDSPQLRF